jgi:hypothetical protein
MNKETNHAIGLEKALRHKAALLRDAADTADWDKDGRSKMAIRLYAEADAAEKAADDLKAAIDSRIWLNAE